MASSNLLLFSVDFLPRRQPGEMVFWQDAIPFLREHFDRIVVVGINHRKTRVDVLADGVELINLPPAHPPDRRVWAEPERVPENFDKLPMAVLYKTWTLLKHAATIDELIRTHDIGVVHFTRIFGFFNRRLTLRHPEVVFTMTVPTHIDRGFPLHHAYHWIKRMGYRGMDRLIPTCEATAERLASAGVARECLQAIHWSFQPPALNADDVQVQALRHELELREHQLLITWSGPLQGTGEKEFQWALDVARRVMERSDRLRFLFAFKPDSLPQSYMEKAAQVPSVILKETSRGEFDALQHLASLFLSPVCNVRRTVAPPLTWIEMMHRGVPVLTTPVAGVDEVLESGISGFVADDAQAATELLLALDQTALEDTGARARRVIATRYDLQDIIAQYAQMWAALGETRKVAR
jgi:glycosyltransferase involved in cell wall biosynthesis